MQNIEKTILMRPMRRLCAACNEPMRADYTKSRLVESMAGTIKLDLQVRRCHTKKCILRHRSYRPEQERDYVLSYSPFGLDVLNFVASRYGFIRDGRNPIEQVWEHLTSCGCKIGIWGVRKMIRKVDRLSINEYHFMRKEKHKVSSYLALSCHTSVVKQDYLDYWGRLFFVRDCISDRILTCRANMVRATSRERVYERIRRDLQKMFETICETKSVKISSEFIICGKYIEEQFENGKPVRDWQEILQDIDLTSPL